MSFNTKPYRIYDAELLLRDAGAAITVSGATGSILDLGGDDLSGQVGTGAAEARADLVLDIAAIDVANANETYTITLQGSDDPAFAGQEEELAVIRLGAAAALALNDVDSSVGRYVIPFYNHRNGTWYRFIRLHVAVAGTTPSIDFSAYLAERA